MEIIDKSNMRQTILDFPKQFRIGLESARNVKTTGTFEKIIICGMGGSALPADILNIHLEAKKAGISLHIHSDYGLPYFANKNRLIICISYSGNTEETISAFQEARSKNLKILAVASGGKLAELCKLYKVPIAIIPAGLQPRMALGFQFSALIKILANCGLIEDDRDEVLGLENFLKPKNLENQGEKLSVKLKNKIPLIYSSRKLKYLARIWKIKLNENAKIPAFYNYFPELNHNEHNQFEGRQSGRLSVIILKNENDHPRILRRMKLLSEMIGAIKIPVEFVEVEGKTTLCKVFNSMLLADWTSYYLALKYKIDPTPVKLNDEFKIRLAK